MDAPDFRDPSPDPSSRSGLRVVEDQAPIGSRISVPLSRLIGRERDVAELLALVRGGRRLVTLVGPGGVGKTRMALHAGAELGPAFADGAVFVDLAPVTDEAMVLPEIGHALGLSGTGEPPDVRLSRGIGAAHVLVLLDNLEQVIAVAPRIAGLLDACPHLQIIATSREPLRISGEQEFPVAPLRPPDSQVASALVAAEASPAVALFVERVQAFRPSFDLTERNAEAIAQICRRLDGLPLALELAAAWCRVLTPEALLLRLSNRLDLLRGKDRTLPERQRTMRAAIGWSYELLTADEQATLRALAVFSGGWTLEAAEAVLSHADTVLDDTAALVDRSLLQVLDAATGDPRYSMLETVREYGLERLTASGEESRVRGAHAAYFLALAERLSSDMGETALGLLARDHANIRGALAWLHAHGSPEQELRLLAGVSRLWYAHSHLREGRAWIESGLARAGHTAPGARGRALLWLGVLAHYGGDDIRAASALDECLHLSQEQGDRRTTGGALIYLGILAEDRGDYDRAMDFLRRGIAVTATTSERALVAQATAHLGIVATGQGDPAAAERYCHEGLALARAASDPIGEFVALNRLANLAREQGDLPTAARRFAWLVSAVALDQPVSIRDHGRSEDVSLLLPGIAALAAEIGRYDAAARLFGAAEALRDEVGLTLFVPERDIFGRAADQVRRALGSDSPSAWDAARTLRPAEITAIATEIFAAVLAPETAPPAPSSPSNPSPTPAPTDHGLTRREAEVLRLLAEGLTNTQLADRLSISPSTVGSHLERIFAKLEVTTRAAAVSVAHRDGLIGRNQT